MMDDEEAHWFAELIMEAIGRLEDHPGLTVEVEQAPAHWLQVLLESSEDQQGLAGFALNFPYREHSGDPLSKLVELGLRLPPGTKAVDWEDGGFAAIWIRPDIPLMALALLIGDVLEKAVGAPADCELSVKIEYGF